MTPAEFKEARIFMGFTSQQALADEWGVDRTTVARWETGKIAIPGPIAYLVRLVMEGD